MQPLSFERRHSLAPLCTRHFKGSKSAAQTNQTDKRIAAAEGSTVVSAENSTVTVTDGGAVSRALDTVDLSNALQGEGFSKILDLTDKLAARGENLIGQTQSAVAQAWKDAQETKAGTIDNKTIIVLAVAAAAAYAVTRSK